MEEKSEKEKRIRALTRLYYSNPKVLENISNFAKNREISPRYFEGFGKRPDVLQYPSDIMGLVQKGATSFHCSEEIWSDVLQLSSEIGKEQMDELRKSWDLLIDIDSPYLDVSKEAAKLVIELIESYGVRNYGLKFSGNKGFHIIVSGNAFPQEFEGRKMSQSFPDWPRAITEFIFYKIKPEFRKRVGRIMSFSHLEKKEKNATKRTCCKQCGKIASEGCLTKLICPVCRLNLERRDAKISKRRLRCLNNGCAGVLEEIHSTKYFFCEECKDPTNEKMHLSSNRYPEMFEEVRGEFAEEYAELDLVLVAPRHLFRMPYSLHEKTALASVVLKKDEIESFNPGDAGPLKVKVHDYMPKNEENEAKKLLSAALEWKKTKESIEEKMLKEKYKGKDFEKSELIGVTEAMFPAPIKKLLKGLNEGRKRGLFILTTFFRAINFSPEQINLKIREWNNTNNPPLKEGYIKSQIDWHLKQKRKIIPPNYSNEAFYKDMGLLDEKPLAKNPLSEVARELRKRK